MLSHLAKDCVVAFTQPTTYQIDKLGKLHIFCGELDIEYQQNTDDFIAIIKLISKGPIKLATVEKHLNTIKHKKLLEEFILSLFELGILYWYMRGSEALKFHKTSSFGHFQEIAFDQILLNNLNETHSLLFNQEYAHSNRCIYKKLPFQKSSKSNLNELLSNRYSSRDFSGRALTPRTLKYLLWTGYGLMQKPTKDRSGRAVPSAGGIYPLRLYFANLNIRGLKKGIYYYCPQCNAFIESIMHDLPCDINDWFRTKHIKYNTAKAIIFIAAFPHSTLSKYGERGYRYLLFEAGHIAQNITLAAIEKGLNSICVGGFDDDKVNMALGLSNRGEAALYSIAIG
jgi:SagB-type dehydrogenase family enzyme